MALFLKFLLILLVIYYGFKLIGRFLFPSFFSNNVNNDEKRRQKAWDDYLFRKKSEEGQVTVDYNKDKNKSRNKEGEYVDYEEIK